MNALRMLMLACACGFAAPAISAEPKLRGMDAELLAELRRGGLVVYFRHATTEHDGAGDHEVVDFANCRTQRNLSAAGRAEAKAIGSAWRKLGLPVGPVVASPYCRARETAELAFGAPGVNADLSFAIDVPAAERKRLGASLRRLLAARPPAGTNSVIVAHTANLREAAGIWPKPEGVAYVFKPLENGEFRPVARVTVTEWTQAAQAADK